MIFTIHRHSDSFMDCTLPNPKWSPHKQAFWSVEHRNWVIEVDTLVELLELCGDARLIIRTVGGLSLEIDDVTLTK